MPSLNLGTLLTVIEFIRAAGLRLGLPLVEQSLCGAGKRIDRRALHRLSCYALASGRLARHAAISDLIIRALRPEGAPFAGHLHQRAAAPISERTLPPDGLTIEPWPRGRRVILDVTVEDTFGPSYLGIAHDARAVAAKAEVVKRAKYESLQQDFLFVPFIIGSTGVWGERALKFVKEFGRQIASREGNRGAAAFIRQRMSVEMQRGNSRLIAGGFLQCGGLREFGSLSG